MTGLRKWFLGFILVGLWESTQVVFGGFPLAWSKTYQGRFLPPSQLEISGLTWDNGKETQSPNIQVRLPGDLGSRYYVQLRGQFKKPETKLLHNHEEVKVDAEGRFTLGIDVTDQYNSFSLMTIDVQGTVQKETFEVVFPEWLAFFEGNHASSVFRPSWSLLPSLGISSVFYQQTDFPDIHSDFHAYFVAPQFQVRYFWDEKWSLDGTVFYRTLPWMTSDQPHLRFFRGEALVTHQILEWSDSHWSLQLSLGYHYNTTFSNYLNGNPSSLGYKDLNGPEFYPTLRHLLAGDRAIWGYVKCSPFWGGSSFLNFKNFEAATGLGFSFIPLSQKHAVELTLDALFLNLQLPHARVRSTSYTLKLGYSI